MMSKYLSILAILLLFVIGCTDESNILSPVDNSNNSSEVVSKPNQTAFPSYNQSLNNFDKTVVGRRDSLIFQDSTKVPSGTVSPNSRWGFIN